MVPTVVHATLRIGFVVVEAMMVCTCGCIWNFFVGRQFEEPLLSITVTRSNVGVEGCIDSLIVAVLGSFEVVSVVKLLISVHSWAYNTHTCR